MKTVMHIIFVSAFALCITVYCSFEVSSLNPERIEELKEMMEELQRQLVDPAEQNQDIIKNQIFVLRNFIFPQKKTKKNPYRMHSNPDSAHYAQQVLNLHHETDKGEAIELMDTKKGNG